MAKEILINQLFAGGYLNEGENIGHEVINLFKDDAGNNNLFITPSGYIKGHELEYILFVRNTEARKTVEVIGLAGDICLVTDDEINAARYAGTSLNQIFSNNIYHGGADTFAHHITFRAGFFRLPSRRIFISIDDGYKTDECLLRLVSDRKVIIPQGMREYYSDEIDAVAYHQLKDYIENNENWEKNNTTEKLFPDGAVQVPNPTLLEVIRKEDDENIFSNLFAYYFEYSHRAFKKFAENPGLLDISNMSLRFDVFREKERVDLWIEGDSDIIIIENKIRSGINGVSGEDYSQLNKYKEKAENEAEKTGKTAHYYIFAPDYARLDLERFGMRKDYKIIRYSKIYAFFMGEFETYIADRAFPDFVRGLKRHTLTFSELQFETMRSRLLRKINQLQ